VKPCEKQNTPSSGKRALSISKQQQSTRHAGVHSLGRKGEGRSDSWWEPTRDGGREGGWVCCRCTSLPCLLSLSSAPRQSIPGANQISLPKRTVHVFLDELLDGSVVVAPLDRRQVLRNKDARGERRRRRRRSQNTGERACATRVDVVLASGHDSAIVHFRVTGGRA